MNSIDQETLERWVDLDSENALEGEEHQLAMASFAELGESSKRLEAIRLQTQRLHAMLDQSKIEVRTDLTDKVMESLPSLGWEMPDELEPILAQSRIKVRTDFTETVMKSLPAPEWESSRDLEEMLAASRIRVADGFTDKVMSSLSRPEWATDPMSKAGWLLPLGLMAGFSIAALALTTFGTGSVDAPAFGLLATLVDFFHVSILAGAGLLFVSWRGLGLGLEEAIGSSGLELVAFGALVLFLNLLLVSLIRRKSARRASVKTRR